MKPPRLLVKSYGHSSTSKWVVEGWKENGKRKRKFFATQKDAETWADLKNTELANYGIRALTMPEDLRLEAVKAAEQLRPFGRSLSEAVDHFISHMSSCARSCTIQLLIEEFVESRRNKGRSHRYVKDLRSRLERFRKVFGNRVTATLTTREIDSWIIGLGLGPQSQNNFRAVLSTLFSYAVSRGYASTHPVSAIEKAKVIADAPGILAPGGMASLLNIARETQPDMLAYLAIGAFAGLRIAELERLAWKNVDLAARYIHVTARASKTAKRRLVKIEANLAAWLAISKCSEEQVRPLNHRTKLLRIREKAKLKSWPPNCLRHGYASYHLAKFQDAPALALQMGHTTTAMIFSHYREIVTAREAESYWQIKPEQEKQTNT